MTDEEDAIIRNKMRENMMNMMGVFSKAVEKQINLPITKAQKYDVSSSLPADAKAKLQLAHGDFVVIPCDKLKDYVEDLK